MTISTWLVIPGSGFCAAVSVAIGIDRRIHSPLLRRRHPTISSRSVAPQDVSRSHRHDLECNATSAVTPFAFPPSKQKGPQTVRDINLISKVDGTA